MKLKELLELIACDESIEIFDNECLFLEKGIASDIFINTEYLENTISLIETFENSIRITLDNLK